MALFMDITETTKGSRLFHFGDKFGRHMWNNVFPVEFNDFHSRVPTDLVGVAESFVQGFAVSTPRPATVKVSRFAGPPTNVRNLSQIDPRWWSEIAEPGKQFLDMQDEFVLVTELENLSSGAYL